MTARLRTTFLGTALLGVCCAGCAIPQRRVPTAIAVETHGGGEARLGERLRDFRFTTPDGETLRLVDVRARVTVLAFPDDPNWPDCDPARELSDLARNAQCGRVTVFAVSVGQPGAPCPDALQHVADCEVRWPRILLVCDSDGTVARLYGSAARGKYYILNNYEEIAAIGELGDVAALRATVNEVVRRIADQDDREGVREWYSY